MFEGLEAPAACADAAFEEAALLAAGWESTSAVPSLVRAYGTYRQLLTEGDAPLLEPDLVDARRRLRNRLARCAILCWRVPIGIPPPSSGSSVSSSIPASRSSRRHEPRERLRPPLRLPPIRGRGGRRLDGGPSRWIALLRRLQDPPVGDLSELVAGMPHAGLIVALGHHVDGDDRRAQGGARFLEAIPGARRSGACRHDPPAPNQPTLEDSERVVAEAHAAIAAGEVAAATAMFSAHLGFWQDAVELYADLVAAGRTLSLAEGRLFADALIRSGQPDDGLRVASGGSRSSSASERP